ncbi:MAG: NAD-dependent succinate-semialdehyde dehydrogenase [Dongiaceae bacterium]
MQNGYPTLGLLIDGAWKKESGSGEAVLNPATEREIAWLPHATETDLEAAIDSAERGFRVWRATSAADRANILRQAARLMADRREAIAITITLEQGKPLGEARLEVDRVVETFDWYAAEATRAQGRIYPIRGAGIRPRTIPEPVGIVLALTPWNFPAFMPARKLAPALAAGCSVILKAAEETPGSAVAIVRALEDAGLPRGVVNLVFGVPAVVSSTILASPKVRKVSFTGSVPVGAEIARLASANLQKCTLELGGHSPVIVFDDVDLVEVAKQTAAFKFRNAGQVCIAPNRFYLHERIYDRFVEEMCGLARKVKLGDGTDTATTMGPMANARRIGAMEKVMQQSREAGAEILHGGERAANRGYFWQPTVVTGLKDDDTPMQEEIFGPIAPLAKFSDTDEVIARANGTRYGLAAYVFSNATATASRVVEQLEAGTVCVNVLAPAFADVPMGGKKESGYGYEGGREGLDEFFSVKTVNTQTV